MNELTASAKISVKEIARLKGESLNTVQKRLRRACVPFEKDASDTRRKLYDPAVVLTASELARWVTEQESPAPADQPGPLEITLALFERLFNPCYRLMFPPVTKPVRRPSRPSRKGFARHVAENFRTHCRLCERNLEEIPRA